MSYWTGPCCRHTYFLQKNGGEGGRTGQDLVDKLFNGQFVLLMKSLCFMMIATKQQACRSTIHFKRGDCGETANLQGYRVFRC